MDALFKQLFPEKYTVALLGVAFPMLWMSVAGLSSAQTYLMCNLGALIAFFGIFLLHRTSSEAQHKLFSTKAIALFLFCMLQPSIDILFPSDFSIYLWLIGGFGMGTAFAAWFNIASRMPLGTNISSICLGTICAFLIQFCTEIGFGTYLGNAVIDTDLLALARGGDVSQLTGSAAIDAALLIIATLLSSILLVYITKKTNAPHEETASANTPNTLQETNLPKPRPGFMVGLFTPFALLAAYFGFSHNFPSGILGNAHTALAPALTIGIVLIAGIFTWLILRINHSDATRMFGMATLVIVLLGMVVLFIDRDNKTFLLASQVCSRAIVIILLWLLAAEFAKRGTFPPLTTFCLTMSFYTAFLCLGLFIGTRSFVMEFLVAFPQEGIYLFTACMTVAIVYGLIVVADFFREALDNRELTVVLETSFIDNRSKEIAEQFGLSEREQEIVELLAHGRTRSYIAENLYLSENTVKWYCRQIYQKLGIHKKQELLTLLGVE